MKRFTKSILALAMLMVGATSVSAEKLSADLTKLGNGPVSTWNGETNTITWVGQSNNMISNFDFAAGNYSSWEKVVVKITELNNAIGVRIQIKANGKEKTKAFNGTGTIEVKLSDYDFTVSDLASVEWVRMLGSGYYDGESHTINNDNPASAVIAEVYFEKPDDPLAVPKENLVNAIASGNARRALGKTTASWNVLQQALSDGVAEYTNASATEESLNNAAKAITDAIAGLKLEVGYTELTADMFKTYSGVGVDATVTGTAGCSYKLFTSTDLPYGDASVGEKNWADLASFDQLFIATIGSVKPRLCFNRIEAGGNEASTKEASKMIDINDNAAGGANSWSETAYLTDDENLFTIDLQAIVSDWGFARLHSIKKQGWGENIVVTDMLLYAAPKSATIGAAGYATFATDRPVKFEGVNAYVAKLNGKSLTLTAVTEVPANTAVILEGAADTYSFPVIYAAAAVDNDLKVANVPVATAGNIYVLANGKNGVGFYQLEVGKSVPAGKAYVELPVDAPALEFIGFDGVVTGIDTVGVDGTDTYKEGVFNLAGQRVAQPTKGLYIVNGKKVIIK
jgi:hypothetical protein